MMHRQRKQSSTCVRSISSSSSNRSSSSSLSISSGGSVVESSVSSPTSDCSLTILSRRCSSNRSRTTSNHPTTTAVASSPSTRRSSATTSSTTSTRRPVLLSVLAWSVTLLLISSCLGIADAGVLMGHPLGKRSFMELQCKGIYDKSIFARLDRVCEDCYNLFREPQLHTLCRKNCFTSDYFKGCVDVLLLQDEMPQIKKWIKQLHGADPGV